MEEYKEALVKAARDPLNQRIVQGRQRLKEDLLDILKSYKSEFERFNTNHRSKLPFIYSNPPDYTRMGLPDWMDSLHHRPLSVDPGPEMLLDPHNVNSTDLWNYLDTMMHGGCVSPGGVPVLTRSSVSDTNQSTQSTSDVLRYTAVWREHQHAPHQ